MASRFEYRRAHVAIAAISLATVQLLGGSGARVEASPRDRAGGGPSGPHTQCVAGQRPDHMTLNSLRNQWNRFAPIGESRVGATSTSLDFACVQLRSFAHDCPAWDPDAGRLAIRACTADLENHLAAAERQIDDYIAGDPRAQLPRVDVSTGDPWPESMAGRSERGLGIAVVRVRALAPDDATLQRFAALRADVAALQDATAKAAPLGGSCADLGQLDKLAIDARGKAAAYLARVARQWRQTRIDKLDAEVRSITRSAPNVMAADLAKLRDEITVAKASATELTCLEPNQGPAVVAAVDAWAERLTKLMAEEQICRDSAPCMKKRLASELAPELCATLDNKRESQARVAELRRNGQRFGVINLVELKEASDDVVLFEQRYKDQSADYRKRIGKAFSSTICKTLEPDPSR